jgi:hypothetical protein
VDESISTRRQGLREAGSLNLGSVRIATREDALVWRLVDDVFRGGDAVILCRRFELDLYRELADAVLENERSDRLLEVLRDTTPVKREAMVV